LSHPGTYPSKGVDTKARHCCRANPRRKRRTEEQLPQHAAFAPSTERGKYRAAGPQRKNFFPAPKLLATETFKLVSTSLDCDSDSCARVL
jgi:hypothetical protein